MNSKSYGYTLVELLFAITLIGTLSMIASPPLQQMLHQNRVATEVNGFLAAVYYARSEAIKQSRRITVCKSDDGQLCRRGGGFDQGWIVFDDRDNDAQRDPMESVLRMNNGMPTGMQLSGNGPVAHYLSFVATGRMERVPGDGGFVGGTLTLCHSAISRQLRFNILGRVRVVEGSPCSE